MTQHDPRKIRDQLGVDQSALLSPKNPKPIIHGNSLLDCLSHEDIFTPEECAQIIADNSPDEWTDSGMTGTAGKHVDHEFRKSKNVWLEKTPETLWIFDKMLALCMSANQFRYQFEIDFFEAIQLAKYEEGDFYEWHHDLGSGNAGNRKLSVSVQLSAPDEYEGGELMLELGEDNFTAPRELGSVTVFPSFLKHKVEPVTKGTRFSLVVWCSGTNRFR